MVAGLETPTLGEIYIGDVKVNNIEPKMRDVAMVFQSYALYPHKTAQANIEFPLKVRGASKVDRAAKAKTAAEALGLTEYLDRKPGQLSGGQRQRVALARAIVRQPAVFCMGTIVIALDAVNAPKTVNNFVFLAAHHYYDGVIFHRIINGFMCQGGDPTGTGRGGPGYRFDDEPVKQRYQIGSVAMANAGPNTNGSQFFLISGPSGVNLPPQYNHFGQIVKGLDVLDAMQRVDTDRGDRPHTEVVINSVTINVAD